MDYLINGEIRDREVRVIDQEGNQLGIMSFKEAQKLAIKAELDLVKIAPQASPPVCKIVDYGKFKYEMVRKAKEVKKNQKVTEIKEIRFSPNIDMNDLQTKMNHARKFLLKGNKVKVSLRFRGREISHINETKQVLVRFIDGLSDIAFAEKEAKQEGRCLVIVLAQKK